MPNDPLQELKVNGVVYDIVDQTARNGLSAKQNTLVSGTNIKTVNGNDLLGSGDITISGGGDTISSISTSYSFTAKSAGAHGYFTVSAPYSEPGVSHTAIGGRVSTNTISALNGAQFTVIYIGSGTRNNVYVTYYCPVATTTTVELTIYIYYK